MSKKDLSQEHDGDDGTQGTTGGAPNSTDSFHPQETNLTSFQESSSQSLTTKAVDETGQVEAGQAGGSMKVVDELAEGDTIEQVMEDVFEEKKDDKDEEEAEAEDEGDK